MGNTQAIPNPFAQFPTVDQIRQMAGDIITDPNANASTRLMQGLSQGGVPVVAPNGDPGFVHNSRLDQFLAQNPTYQRGMVFTDPKGNPGFVPVTQAGNFQKENPSYKPGVPAQTTGWNPAEQSPFASIENFKKAFPSFQAEPGSLALPTLPDVLKVPIAASREIADYLRAEAENPHAPGIVRNISSPIGEAAAQFVGSNYDPQNLAMLLASQGLSTLGPNSAALRTAQRGIGAFFAGKTAVQALDQASQAHQAYQRGDIPEAVRQGTGAALSGGMAADIGTQTAANIAANPHEALSDVGKPFIGAVRAGRGLLDPLSNMSPSDLAIKATKPRNTIRDVNEKVDQALPWARAAVTQLGIDPDEMGHDEALDATRQAKQNVWDTLEQNHLAPASSFVRDTTPIADRIQAVADGMSDIAKQRNPNLVQNIEAMAESYPNQMSVRNMEQRIQELNNELYAEQSKLKVQQDQLRRDPAYAYQFAELDGLRSTLDKALNDITGPGAKELKQTYGSLKTLEDMVERSRNVAERASPVGLFGGLGKVAGLGNIAAGGLRTLGGDLGGVPQLAKGAAEMYMGKKAAQMNDRNFLLREAFKRAPEGPGAPPPVPPPPSIPVPQQQTPPPQRTGPWEMPASTATIPEQGALPPGPQRGALPAGPPEPGRPAQLPAPGETAPARPGPTGPFNLPPSLLGPQTPALPPATLESGYPGENPNLAITNAPSAAAEQARRVQLLQQGRGIGTAAERAPAAAPTLPQAPSGKEPLAAAGPAMTPQQRAQDTLEAARNMTTRIDRGGPDRAAVIYLDENAYRIFQNNGRGGWLGVNLHEGDAQGISRSLDNYGLQLERSGERNAAWRVQNLARQIDEVSQLNNDPNAGHAGVPLVREAHGWTLQHEAIVHGGQRILAGGQGDITNFTDLNRTLRAPGADLTTPVGDNLHPAIEKAWPQLDAMGATVHPGVVAAEMEAHILDGNHARLGLTREDAVSYIKHALDVLAEHHGPDVMENLPQLAQRYVQALQDYVNTGGESAVRTIQEQAAGTPYAEGAGRANAPNAPPLQAAEGAEGRGGREAYPAGFTAPEEVGRAPLAARELPGEADRISTRNPTAKSRTENPLEQNLQIDTQAIRDTPAAKGQAPPADIIAGLLRQYPGSAKFAERSTNATLSGFQRQAKDNLIFMHDNYPEEFRNESKKWYDGANNLVAQQWPREYGTTDIQGAGGIAAMSPKLEWNKNVSLEKRLIEAMKQQNELRYTPKMVQRARTWMEETPPNKQADLAAALNQIKGKRLGDLQTPVQKALWIQLYDEAEGDPSYDIYMPDGSVVGKAVTKQGEPASIAWATTPNIAKAVSIFEDPSRENVSKQLGEAHKIRSFFNNQIAPNSRSGDVTIDTHAIAADQVRPLALQSTEVLHNFGGGAPGSSVTGVQGTYGVHADAYRDAADERDLLPRQMQSITWDNARSVFPRSFKTETNQGIIDQIWRDHDNGKLTAKQAREAAIEAAGGWKPPDWARYRGAGRSGSSGAETVGSASQSGQLSGAGAPGPQRGGSVARGGSTAAARTPKLGQVQEVVPPNLRRIVRK